MAAYSSTPSSRYYVGAAPVRFANGTKVRPAEYIAALVLGVVAPALLLADSPGSLTLEVLLSCSIAAYSSWKLSRLAFTPRPRYLQLTFWLFVYCWLGLAAAVQTKTGIFPWPAFRQSPANILRTDVVIIMGLTAYEFGVRNRRIRRITNGRRLLRPPDFTRYLTLIACCIALSLASIEAQGGLKSVLITRYDASQAHRAQESATSAVLLYSSLQRVPPMIGLLVTLYLFMYVRYRRRRASLAAILVVLVIYNLIANYPPSLPRVSLGSDVIAISILLLGKWRQWRAAFTFAMIAVLAVLFPYLDYFRSSAGYTLYDIQRPSHLLAAKPDYDAFQMISNSVAAASDYGNDYGYHILGSALFFIPRHLWPEKPYGTGHSVAMRIGYRFLDVSSPLWSEFYYAAGLPLVILGFWIYGRFSRRLEWTIHEAPTASLVFVAYVAGFQIFLLRGDLLNAVAYSVPSIALLMCFLVRPGTREINP